MAKNETSSSSAYSMKKGLPAEDMTKALAETHFHIAPAFFESSAPPKRTVVEVFHSHLHPFHLGLLESPSAAETRSFGRLREELTDAFRRLEGRYGKEKMTHTGGVEWEHQNSHFVAKINSSDEHMLQKSSGGTLIWSLTMTLAEPGDIKLVTATDKTSDVALSLLHEFQLAVPEVFRAKTSV